MNLISTAFQNNGKIPKKYTCDGENISPELIISDVPEETESLVLIMDDPDIPSFVKEKFNIQVWDHWIVFNMSANINKIHEDEQPLGVAGKGTNGKLSYSGPCPPDREHRYFFKLYALDTKLNLKEGSSKREVEEAMDGHIIEKVELVGKYKRD